MARSIFTKEEVEFIKEHYCKMNTKDIAIRLNKTPKQVKGKADGLKLRKGVVINRFSKEDETYIIDNYNKVPTKEISEHLNRTVKQINDKAYDMGLRRDLFRYEYDETYFEIIDSEEKAYWLGFIYADGCISQIFNKNTGALKSRTLEITLAEVDRDHLAMFAKSIKSDVTPTLKNVTLNGINYASYRLQVYNKKICQDLINLGCHPAKSLTLEFPEEDIVPSEFRSHFVRGYFDGDGCVSTDMKWSYIVNFVGTKDILDGIRVDAYEKMNLSMIEPSGKGNALQVSWGGFYNLKRWYEYLYRDATIFLDRKHDIFVKAIEEKTYSKDVAYYHRNAIV